MRLDIGTTENKDIVFSKLEDYLRDGGLKFTSSDSSRPWGGFFVIDESQSSTFINRYFSNYPLQQINQYGNKLSPKILVVEPNKRLSWQYHLKRAELWRVIKNPVGYIVSNNDTQGEVKTLKDGETVQFDSQIRHRLVGLDQWGIVAEIWQHIDNNQPSNEEDIIRLEDDFGR